MQFVYVHTYIHSNMHQTMACIRKAHALVFPSQSCAQPDIRWRSESTWRCSEDEHNPHITQVSFHFCSTKRTLVEHYDIEWYWLHCRVHHSFSLTMVTTHTFAVAYLYRHYYIIILLCVCIYTLCSRHAYNVMWGMHTCVSYPVSGSTTYQMKEREHLEMLWRWTQPSHHSSEFPFLFY